MRNDDRLPLFGDDDDEPDDAISENRPGLWRQDHPDTSRAAALAATTGAIRWRVYVYVKRKGGAIDEEIIAAGMRVGFTENGIRPRRVELVRDGYLVNSGRTRRTTKNRDAIIWVITDKPATEPQLARSSR